MEQIELSTTKYVRESLQNEVKENRKANRKSASQKILMLAASAALFAVAFYVATNNPQLIESIKLYLNIG